MMKLLSFLKNLPDALELIRISLNKDKYSSVNLYFQDESRFGLMTHVGRCLTAVGVKPIVKYKHAFKNTYLYGSFSPIDGDMFVYEIEGTTSEIFYKYLCALSEHRPNELKILVIDNAGFHSMKNYEIPENIKLLRIPPYSPELNPSEKIWAYIKLRYKNKVFDNLEKVKSWLARFIKEKLTPQIVKGITNMELYNDQFKVHFEI